jgi:alkaline phosphatase D
LTKNDPPRRDILKRAGVLAASVPFASNAWGAALGYPRAQQGPMLGAPSPDAIVVWARASGAFDVQLEVSPDRAFAEPLVSAPASASEANDYCVRLRVEGLRPATTYFYRLRLDGALDRYQPRACSLTRCNRSLASPPRLSQTSCSGLATMCTPIAPRPRSSLNSIAASAMSIV